MPYILDIIIILLLIFFALRGAKKGLIDTAFGILSFFLAGILALVFYIPFTNYVESTPWGAGIKDSIHTYVYNGVSDSLFDEDNTEAEDNKSSENVIDNLKLPEFLREDIYQKAEFMIRNTAESAIDAVSDSLAITVFRLLCSIALFLIFIIVLFIVKKLLGLVFKLPVLKTVNKAGGAAAGLVKGALIVYLILALIGSVSAFGNVGWISDTLGGSYFYQATIGNNFILKMFS